MATLINYDQSTFRDQPHSKQRRFQELQHSEARAHAARVAYWRKRSSTGPVRSQKMLQRGDEDDEATSTSSSVLFQTMSSSDVGDWRPAPESTWIADEHKIARGSLFLDETGSEDRQSVQSSRSDANSLTSSTSNNVKGGWGSVSPGSRIIARKGVYDSPGLAEYAALSRPPSSSLFDPLASFPITQGKEVTAAIDHYITNWAPSQRPCLKYQTRDNPLISETFPSALHNVELFEAIVALCLSFKAAGQGFQADLSKAALHHKGQALAGIRGKLASGTVDEAVVMATVFLMIIDNVFLDVQAYKAHLEGLRNMVTSSLLREGRGTLLSFVSWAQCNALLIFGDITAPRDTTFDGSKLRYPKKPFPTRLLNIINVLTPGFRSIAMDGHLSTEVLRAIGDTVRWTTCIDHLYGETPPDENQTFLMEFDPRANSARLMRLCRISGPTHKVEEAVCKALFIYHANLLNWTCRCSGYRRVVVELAEAVRLCDTHEVWSRDFWSWVALVTANAARRGGMQQVQIDAMDAFTTLRGGSHPWESTQQLLRQFLIHSTLERECRICWERATASDPR